MSFAAISTLPDFVGLFDLLRLSQEPVSPITLGPVLALPSPRVLALSWVEC